MCQSTYFSDDIFLWLNKYNKKVCSVTHVYNHFLPNALESRSLHRQQGLDIGRTTEYAFEIHPTALHVDPYVEQSINAIQFLLPS